MLDLFILLMQPAPYALPPGEVVWERRPTVSDHLIPPTTARLLDTKFDMYCTVMASGHLRDCFIPKAAEHEPQAGLALKMVRGAKVARVTRSGEPTAGRTIRIPMKFTTSDD